jgi:hypothetical protein
MLTILVTWYRMGHNIQVSLRIYREVQVTNRFEYEPKDIVGKVLANNLQYQQPTDTVLTGTQIFSLYTCV